MEFFKTPTDNLYKFIALTGTAIVALMLILLHQHIGSSFREYIELEASLNQQGLEFDALMLRLDAYDDEAFASLTEKGIMEKLGDKEYHRQIENFAGIDANLERIKMLDVSLYLVSILYVVFAVLGALTAFTGFRLWYVKLQRYLDKKLELEVSLEVMPDETIENSLEPPLQASGG